MAQRPMAADTMPSTAPAAGARAKGGGVLETPGHTSANPTATTAIPSLDFGLRRVVCRKSPGSRINMTGRNAIHEPRTTRAA